MTYKIRKLYVVFILLFFFLKVPIVSAQYVNQRYCHSPNDTRIFTGIAYNESGTPQITIGVDPTFKKAMEGEQKIASLSISVTPIYDLVVTVIPTYNHYCLPIWDSHGMQIAPENLPDSLPFSADIVLSGGQKKDETITSGSFENGHKNEDGAWEYDWKIKGWPDGITSGSKMEDLIDALQNGTRQIKIIVHVPEIDGTFTDSESDVNMSLCAPVYGSGEFKVVTMRGKSANESLSNLILFGYSTVKSGFEEIQPFAKYSSHFSQYIDLGNYDDYQYGTRQVNVFDGKSPHTYYINPYIPEMTSACPSSRLYYFLNNRSYFAYTQANSKDIFINPKEVDSATVMHEAGHAFAGLEDEYIVTDNISDLTASTILSRFGENCTLSPPEAYTYNKKYYGNQHKLGCFTYANQKYSVFRPSNNSIMNTGNKFNMISCAYVISAILGDSTSKLHLPECFKLDGLEDSGKYYDPSQALNYYLPFVLNKAEYDPNIAAVGVSGQEYNSENIFWLVDNFDSKNRSGAIMEVNTGGRLVNSFKPKPSNSPSPIQNDSSLRSLTDTSTGKDTSSKSVLLKSIGIMISGTEEVFSNMVRIVSAVFTGNQTSPVLKSDSNNSPNSAISPSHSPTRSISVSPAYSSAPSPSSAQTKSPGSLPTTYSNLLPRSSPTQSSSPTPIGSYQSVSPTPSTSPGPTHNPTSTYSSSPSSSPSTTPTLLATPTPTPSSSSTVTPTPTATFSATPTPSPKSSSTPTPAPTQSTTPSPTPYSSFSPTPTPTHPIQSSTPTPTPSSSSSPSPSSSPSAFNTNPNQSVLGLMVSSFISPWMNMASAFMSIIK